MEVAVGCEADSPGRLSPLSSFRPCIHSARTPAAYAHRLSALFGGILVMCDILRKATGQLGGL
jgi:hypothetical protein